MICNKLKKQMIKPLPAEANRFLLRLKVVCFEPQNVEVKNVALFC